MHSGAIIRERIEGKVKTEGSPLKRADYPQEFSVQRGNTLTVKWQGCSGWGIPEGMGGGLRKKERREKGMSLNLSLSSFWLLF